MSLWMFHSRSVNFFLFLLSNKIDSFRNLNGDFAVVRDEHLLIGFLQNNFMSEYGDSRVL